MRPLKFQEKKLERDTQKAERFWSWFSENSSKYAAFTDFSPEETKHFMSELTNQLHRFNRNLFFELGRGAESDRFQFVVTAAGNIKYFPDVELLCSKAPSIKSWDIVAFKPALGAGLKIHFRGREFNPRSIRFLPLESKLKPDVIGIHICYDDFNQKDRDIFIGGTYLILDFIIGERATTLDINYMDVIKTPRDIESFEYRYLSELPDYINEKKKLSQQ